MYANLLTPVDSRVLAPVSESQTNRVEPRLKYATELSPDDACISHTPSAICVFTPDSRSYQ